MTCYALAAVFVVNTVVSITLDFFDFLFHFEKTPFVVFVTECHIIIIKKTFLNILYKNEKR